jgi:hypothetical protein
MNKEIVALTAVIEKMLREQLELDAEPLRDSIIRRNYIRKLIEKRNELLN